MVEVYILAGFLIVTIIGAIEGFHSVKGIKHDHISENKRIKLYKSSILWGWAQTFVCIAVLIYFNVSFRLIGFNMPLGVNYKVNLVFALITYIVCGGLLILLLYQILMFVFSEKYRIELLNIMEKKIRISGEDIMIPRKKAEKLWFAFCSLTAAVGEEIVYRGFLFYLLNAVFQDTSAYVILIIASSVFGFAHIYQGLWGMLKTSLIGFMLGALYLASGSLIYGIILHFIIDFASCFLYTQNDL